MNGLQSRDFFNCASQLLLCDSHQKKNVSGKLNFIFSEEESLKGHIFSEALTIMCKLHVFALLTLGKMNVLSGSE